MAHRRLDERIVNLDVGPSRDAAASLPTPMEQLVVYGGASLCQSQQRWIR
jgi:hypothetical protein